MIISRNRKFLYLEYFEKMKYNNEVFLYVRRHFMIEYLTVKEMAERWGITSRMVTVYCKEERIPGAIKKGNLWLIPGNVDKPDDNRKNNGKNNRQGSLK